MFDQLILTVMVEIYLCTISASNSVWVCQLFNIESYITYMFACISTLLYVATIILFPIWSCPDLLMSDLVLSQFGLVPKWPVFVYNTSIDNIVYDCLNSLIYHLAPWLYLLLTMISLERDSWVLTSPSKPI